MKLLEQIKNEAKPYGIIVEEITNGVELLAPDGYCFDEELHGLVSVQWDNEPMPNVYRRAIRDIREGGPRLRKCADDCGCRENLEGLPHPKTHTPSH